MALATKSTITERSEREIFVDKYIDYLCSMPSVSKITCFNGYFYELILFVHENTEKHNVSTFNHKIKNNCLFVNKIFDNAFKFADHGDEYNMYAKYIMTYCPDEIQHDTMQGHTQQEVYYGCNFECPTTFKLIAEKLKGLGYTKQSLLQQQKELEISKHLDSQEIFESKQKKFKQTLITTKNICGFVLAVQAINK